MPMLRLTNSTVLLGERIRKLRYTVLGFLLFDLVYGAVLVALIEEIRSNLFGYHTVTFLYTCAVLAGIFGAKDKIALLFYPILVFIIPIVIGCLYLLSANTIQLFICWKYKGIPVSNFSMPLVDSRCYNMPDFIIHKRLISGFVGFVILVEKILEFIVIRKLMKLFSLTKVVSPTTLEIIQGRSLQPTTQRDGRHTAASYDISQPEKVMGEIKDSDDDMVVYQSKKFHHDFPQASSSNFRPPIPPPMYENVATPQSENILPIKKDSKHAIE